MVYLHVLGQVTDSATKIIESAETHGWEAALLAFIVLTSIGFFGWLMRQNLVRHLSVEERILSEAKQREERLATRITDLENKFHCVLVDVLKQNSEVMGKVMVASDSMVRAAEKLIRAFERFSTVVGVCPLVRQVNAQDSDSKLGGKLRDDNAVG